MFFFGDIAYLVTLYLCLFFSLWNRNNNNSLLYLYFILVVIVETFAYTKVILMNHVYSYVTFLYIGFFALYYRRVLDFKFPIIFTAAVVSMISCVYFLVTSDQSLPIGLGITLAVFYIFVSLLWTFVEVRENTQVLITRKESFWVSVALLFWSICFLFRLIPMYWLEKNDAEFLKLIAKAFKICLIITYTLFLVAVTRKRVYLP